MHISMMQFLDFCFGIVWCWQSIFCFQSLVSLPHMSICTRVVVAVTFEQVDNAPDTETGTERDNEGLKNGDCLFKKCHIVC